MRVAKLASRRKRYTLFSGAIAIAAFVLPSVAHAEWKSKVLHSFGTGADGSVPFSGLISGPDGTLYGTTEGGGSSDAGAVYKITPDKQVVILHSFSHSEGDYPLREPALDSSGNLYVTTCCGTDVDLYGAVFRLTPDGGYAKLYSFLGRDDGNTPEGITLDVKRNIYGVTYNGGENNDGVVYKITSKGQFKVLHTFGGDDGANPAGTPIVDRKGNIYGTTQNGGANGDGVIYEVTPKGEEKILHSFNYDDGISPVGGVVRDDDGNLYGATQGGGANYGGTLFELSASGVFTVLHTFGGTGDGSGAGSPPTLVKNEKGKIDFYGTTQFGGALGAGIAYKYWGNGNYKVLHTFTGGASDAYVPQGLLAVSSDGNLYGASNGGGSANRGTVFEFRAR